MTTQVQKVVFSDEILAFKYILAEVVASDGSKAYVIRTGGGYHKDILSELQGEEGVQSATCKGGGEYFKSDHRRQISMWGYSDKFGSADTKIVAGLLEAEFPGWRLDLTNSARPPS